MFLELLLIVVTSAHLLAVNVAVGGPIICLWLHARQVWHNDEYCGQLGRRLLIDSLMGLLAGVLLGMVALGLVWHVWPGVTRTVIGQLPARRYWFGLAELAFSLLLLAGYAAWWRHRPGRTSGRSLAGMWTLAALAWTNLAYHFPLLFAALATVSTDNRMWNQPLTFLQMAARPETWSRAVHFLLASLAVAGLLGVWRVGVAQGAAPAESAVRARVGLARWALFPTALQLIVGVVVLMFLPQASRDALMGARFAAAMVFLVSLVAAVGLMHKLATLALAEARPADLRHAVVLMLATVVLMTAARHLARQSIVSLYELTMPAAVEDLP